MAKKKQGLQVSPRIRNKEIVQSIENQVIGRPAAKPKKKRKK